jgi:hypothetical protein
LGSPFSPQLFHPSLFSPAFSIEIQGDRSGRARRRRRGSSIHIPLDPDKAIRLLMQVEPTADMPRQGAAHPVKKKRAKKAK